MTIIIFSCFPPEKSILKFRIFKLKLLITFELIAVDTFWGKILNQHSLFVTLHEFEQNQWTVLITNYPPIRRTRAFAARRFRVITGPPREKKASDAAEFICIKKHIENAHNCGLRASRRILRSFLDVSVLDLFGANIQFFMMFRLSVVYVCVFGSHQI